jgi:hypothetical protein
MSGDLDPVTKPTFRQFRAGDVVLAPWYVLLKGTGADQNDPHYTVIRVADGSGREVFDHPMLGGRPMVKTNALSFPNIPENLAIISIMDIVAYIPKYVCEI